MIQASIGLFVGSEAAGAGLAQEVSDQVDGLASIGKKDACGSGFKK